MSKTKQQLEDSGQEALVSGVYQATPTTLADGESGDIALNANHAVKTDMDTQIAGERNPDSENNYIVVSGEWNITTVDLATDADVVVSSVPSLLKKVYVNVVMSAHDAIIKDSSTEKLRIAASSAVGTEKDFDGAKFLTNITIESDNAATGTLAVLWRAI